MARIRAKDYDDKREQILAKAAELFMAQGFHNTSMSELAAACMGSKARLYHYYESKEAILHGLLDRFMRALTDGVKPVLESRLPPEQKLRDVARVVMRAYSAHTESYAGLFNDIGALPEKQRVQILKLEENLVREVLKLLSALRPDIMQHPNRRRPLAMIFFGALNWTFTWYNPSGPLSPEDFADLATSLVLGRPVPGPERNQAPDDSRTTSVRRGPGAARVLPKVTHRPSRR